MIAAPLSKIETQLIETLMSLKLAMGEALEIFPMFAIQLLAIIQNHQF